MCDRMLREGMVTLYCLHLAVWGGVAVFFLDMCQLCRKSHHVPGTACWGWQMALEVPVAAADCWKNLKTQRRQHTTGYQIQSPVRKAMHFHNCLQPAASRSFAFFLGQESLTRQSLSHVTQRLPMSNRSSKTDTTLQWMAFFIDLCVIVTVC